MHPPRPLIRRKIKGVVRLRPGRGFSINEIREVGLTVREARRLGLYVDENRRSKREENMKILIGYLSTVRASEEGGDKFE
ncbi:MAG: ribosomal protein L13e [Candidatus Caldarchaeales archaeon]